MAIKEVIERIIDEKVVITVLSGTVKALESDMCTVVVDDSEKELFKVSLTALKTNSDEKLLIVPKIGSKVILGVLPNGEDAVLLNHSMVDRLYFKKGSLECEIDSTGYRIERESENLKTVLNEFIDEVNKIVVINGTTINKAAVLEIKDRLNKILK